MTNGMKPQILIVDDRVENLQILLSLLKQDYRVISAKSGFKAIDKAQNLQPDLILLDILMPEMDGYEVCRRLKNDETTSGIPVIFITTRGEVSDETKGFELGAVDYIIKPISPPIVKARVATHLKLQEQMLELKRLYSMALDANPMTGLPGNNSIANRIKKALEKNEAVCVIYSDLDNFKAFNDKYGFALGDDVLLFTSNVFKAVVKSSDAFIGHIGGDDFVAVIPASYAQESADKIIQEFDQGIMNFYSPEDIAAKCIQSVNRQGQPQTFPLMSISLAGVDLSQQGFNQYIEVNDACASAKKMAKAIPGSSFFMDRRCTKQSSKDAY
jgi:diguanylate cyclase (GGDEF)-like protein